MKKAILKAISRDARRAEAITRLRLQAARFRQMLENAQALLAQVADGREKGEGEYIFDKQYVLSLVDNLLEYSGLLVLDACTLAPAEGDKLLALFDEQKRFAHDDFFGAGLSAARQPGVEPEFALLSRVLQWCEEGTGPEQKALMSLVRQAFDHVFERLNREGDQEAGLLDEIELIEGAYRLQLLLVPEHGEEYSAGKTHEGLLPCRPFGSLRSGLHEIGATRATSGAVASRWLAVMSEERLLLRGLFSGRQAWVAAAMTGLPSEDFAFAFLPRGLTLAAPDAGQFRLDTTSLGVMAWRDQAPAEALEGCLATLGKVLFGSPEAGSMEEEK
jgi:hypothetical protein